MIAMGWVFQPADTYVKHVPHSMAGHLIFFCQIRNFLSFRNASNNFN